MKAGGILTLLIVALVGIVVPARAQLDAAIQEFDRGNEFYLAGDFDQAVQSYEFAISRGFVSGELYYNLANAYFRVDQIGQAIRYYEKALALGDARPEIAHNLEIARERRTDRFSELPRPGWARLIDLVVSRVSPNIAFALGLVAYLAGVIAVCLALFRVLLWPSAIRAGAWTAGVGLLIAGIGIAISVQREANRRAIVVVHETVLRETPDPNSAGVTQLHDGLDVRVVSSDSAWVEVRLPNGRLGWLPSSDLGDI